MKLHALPAVFSAFSATNTKKNYMLNHSIIVVQEF